MADFKSRLFNTRDSSKCGQQAKEYGEVKTKMHCYLILCYYLIHDEVCSRERDL